jgi:hypothetical protein
MVVVEPQFDKKIMEGLRDRTLSKLGYGRGSGVDTMIVSTLDDVLDTATRVARLKGIYQVLPVLGTGTSGVETKAGVIHSEMFTRLVHTCSGKTSIAFMIATIGEELEEIGRARSLVFDQLVYDTAGSELAEMMADLLEADCREKADNSGLQLSSRFSPGYCDWSLEGQEVIFSSIDAGLINVRLTSKLVMVPSKSVSAIAVVAEEMPITVPCVLCPSEDCPWRRSP